MPVHPNHDTKISYQVQVSPSLLSYGRDILSHETVKAEVYLTRRADHAIKRENGMA